MGRAPTPGQRGARHWKQRPLGPKKGYIMEAAKGANRPDTVRVRDEARGLCELLEGLYSVVELCKCSDSALIDASILEPLGASLRCASDSAERLRRGIDGIGA